MLLEELTRTDDEAESLRLSKLRKQIVDFTIDEEKSDAPRVYGQRHQRSASKERRLSAGRKHTAGASSGPRGTSVADKQTASSRLK